MRINREREVSASRLVKIVDTLTVTLESAVRVLRVVAPGEVLTIYSGNSAPMKLKFDELKQFQDKKGQRRQRFSRAYKQVDRLEVAPA